MASHRLVAGLLRVFASLLFSLAPPCDPCVEGQVRATPHSSSLRPTTAPFQTLHLDVCGPAARAGPERERFFLVVVDNYSRYTTVFPLAKKSEVTSTLIRWLLATKGTRGSCVRCLHSDRRFEFRSGILAGFCGELGITQSWTLPETPQQNGVVECRIGLVMDIARISMIHARAPHFLWPHADSSDLEFYHPPLHRFLNTCDVRFDESASYYTRYPYKGLLVPPPPLFLAPSPPLVPAPPVPQPPMVLPNQLPSALPRHVTVDSGGLGAGGAATGGARSGGVRFGGAGAGGACIKGAGAGVAGAGSTGAGGASTRGASSRGAGPQVSDLGGCGSGSAGTGGASFEGVGARSTSTSMPSSPPHRHDTRYQVACRRACKEQERLAQERQELQQLDQQEQQEVQQEQQQRQPQQQLQQQLFPPMSGLWALGLPSSSPVRTLSPAFRPTFPPPDMSPAVSSSPWSPSPPPVVPHSRVRPCPPRAHPSSSLMNPHCTPLFYALPVFPRVLTSLVTDPCSSPSPVSALTAAVTDFAATCHLDFPMRVVATLPARPLSAGGEIALGCAILEDRQFELEFLATASPSLYAMLLSPEGDPDALDIPTRTYCEVVSGQWASQWKAAMDSEMASCRPTGTYVDAVPPPRANEIDVMWIFKVKRPPGSPPVFKARYVARGFRQREGVDFF
ncbi:unnamed protein product [Closterium sp. NIES-54]